MRTLLLFGTLVTAVLVPWSSITPPWTADAAGSTGIATSAHRSRPALVRLATSILPLVQEHEEADAAVSEHAGAVASDPKAGDEQAVADTLATGQLPPGVHCENGVCTIPQSTFAQSPRDHEQPSEPTERAAQAAPTEAVGEELTWPEAQQRLRRLGVTQFRLETGLERGQFRFSCSRPSAEASGIAEQFAATAATDMDAVAQVLAQLEAAP
jgi:hypothetical protein